MGCCVGRKSTKMYKIPKLVHFRSKLILSESNKTHRRKPTVGPWHTDSVTEQNARTWGKQQKNIIGRKFNLKSFLWAQKEVEYY